MFCSPLMRSVVNLRTKGVKVLSVLKLTCIFNSILSFTALSQRCFILEAVSVFYYHTELFRREQSHDDEQCPEAIIIFPTNQYFSPVHLRWKWSVLVIDEAHRLKNQNSQLHKTLTEVLKCIWALYVTCFILQSIPPFYPYTLFLNFLLCMSFM